MTSAPTPTPTQDEVNPNLTMQGKALTAWRRQQREQLLERRLRAGGPQRRIWNGRITPSLRPLLPDAPGTVFGLYWPYMGEYAIRPLMRDLHDRGGSIGLPHVATPKAPLEFLRWHPDVEMVRGVHGIAVPKDTPAVRPEVLVVPLVGFDAAGYRLGYGGGYYDRTIAAFSDRPLLIGVGYELSRLETIYPQAHDIPMDYLVTEAGVCDCR